MAHSVTVLLIGLVCLHCCHCLPKKEGDVIILNDDNFDRETATGVWMVDIFAPWCSHCQQLEPVWQAFATEMKEHNVKVAKLHTRVHVARIHQSTKCSICIHGQVNGMDNRVLMKRFDVKGFPSIYLLRNGQTWQYNGVRGIEDMRLFALEDYKQTTPMPFHKAPNSLMGRAIGLLHSFPAYAKRGYEFLKEEKGFSDMAIIAGVLLIPVALGAVFICVLDAMYSRQQHFDHQHYE